MNTDLYMWLAAAAAFLVGSSKGGLPAIGMLAVPLMSLVMPPVDAAVMLLPIYVISDVMGVYLYRRDYSANNLRILVPASVVGVVIGWLTASMVSDRIITFLIGAMGVAFCLNVWLRKQANAVARQPSVPKGSFWGLIAGFTSFISHAGAPPFQVYMLPQKLPKAEFAGTATILFAVINAAKILPYQFLRPYSMDSLRGAAILVPFALVGAVSGAYLTRRVAEVWFYRIAQAGLFVVSVKLIADSLKGLWG